MKKKKTYKEKIRFVALFLLLLICIASLGFTISNYIYKISNKKSEQATLEKELKKLLTTEVDLKLEVEKLEDPDYVARYAREKYLYSKDGEIIIKID